jgi:glycerol-3-phosphate dehydrogenase (NAD(P)+)
MNKKKVGVIGAGSFGVAIAKLLSHNTEVLLYSRRPEVVDMINMNHQLLGVQLSDNVFATNDRKTLAENCQIIFPVVTSAQFRETIRGFREYLFPYHFLIHGTKGFDVTDIDEGSLPKKYISRKNIHTMSEVILQESSVIRIGCLSGPNLASEIIAGQPTATLIASRFTEVIHAGQTMLNSKRFHVFGSYELLGAELAGALKNVFALGSGILAGKGLGKNIQAMLITRGVTEMANIGIAMGASYSAFLGTAGIGDLVATATSVNSRNYTFGSRLAQGESTADISATMPEVAEGVRTLRIANSLSKHYKLHTPIVTMLHKVVFENFDLEKAIDYLMEYPYAVDVDFV